jgi:hypothetical protein
MTKVRLKYLHCFRDRHGKPRCFFRYRGQRWPLPLPGTEGFATAYDGLLAHIKANPFRSGASVEYLPGSLGWTIEKFLGSPLYSNRAESTKRNYRRILDQLRQNYGAGLLAICSRITSGRFGTNSRQNLQAPPILEWG